jgi:hypothetical protein
MPLPVNTPTETHTVETAAAAAAATKPIMVCLSLNLLHPPSPLSWLVLRSSSPIILRRESAERAHAAGSGVHGVPVLPAQSTPAWQAV